MSAVVHVEAIEAPAGIDLKVLERLTAAAFGQRRKMLRQSLKSVAGALDALATLGIDETRRAETLTVEQFVAVARLLSRNRVRETTQCRLPVRPE
jgi:16S rRNA (adenine1518-N6/adenine1519-N6)-dimethyltransferase